MFRTAEARARFLHAFDRAMSAWPERADHLVETRFGPTAASVTAHSGPGAPIVLLQGGGSVAAVWASFAEAWRTARPVVAVDTIWDAGRGVQRRPVLTGTDAAAWLDDTLDGLGIRHAHLVGYSYGGWAALNQAVLSPSRLLSVTAIEPPATLARMPLRAWWRVGRMLLGGEAQYRSFLQWVRGGRLPEPQVLEVLMAARRDFVQRGSPRPRLLSQEQLRDIQAPVAVVLGGRSAFLPARAAAAAVRRGMPQARLHVLPDAGHAVLVDEPAAVMRAVDELVVRHDRARS